MEPLRAGHDTPLEWVQQAKRRFELRGDDTVFATMELERGRGLPARVALHRETWIFRRRGLLRHHVALRPEGRMEWTARLWLDGPQRGALVLVEGGGRLTPLRWSGFSWDSEDDWLIRYHNASEWNALRSRLELDPSVLEAQELPLLLCLGWYAWMLGQLGH